MAHHASNRCFERLLRDPSTALPWSGEAEPVTSEEIRKTYYRLAKIFHPDKNHGNEQAAVEQFKKLQEASEILCDPEKRREYDGLRSQILNAKTVAPAHSVWNFNFPAANNTQPGATKRQRGHHAHTSEQQWAPKKKQKNTAGSGSQSTHKTPGPEFTRRAAPQHDHPPPQPPVIEATPDLPDAFDFSLFEFCHYYYKDFRETPFLGILRKGVSDGKHEVRRAQTAVHVARINVQTFGASYMSFEGTIRYDMELRQQESHQIWWTHELERREKWLKAHEKIARTRRGTERMRRVEEKQAEGARENAAEHGRDNVKMKSQSEKVEVIEIEDSDDDAHVFSGVNFDGDEDLE